MLRGCPQSAKTDSALRLAARRERRTVLLLQDVLLIERDLGYQILVIIRR